MILAIDIGGTAVKAGLFTEENPAPIQVTEQPTVAKQGVAALVDQLCGLVEEQGPVDRVGISCTGQVDAPRGEVVFATQAIPGLTGTPLRQILEDRLRLPVALDNDVNCAAIGEAHYGAARDFPDFLCLTIGTGIGGAIVLDRRIYGGMRGIAGEVGHMLLHAGPEGAPCACGKQGCYEAHASTTALIRRVRDATGEQLNGREIFARFDEPGVRRAIDSWLDEVAAGLVSLTHIFSPPCFVLGGGILNEPYVLEQISARLRERVLPSYAGVQVRRAALGNLAGMYGAYHNAFTLPAVSSRP